MSKELVYHEQYPEIQSDYKSDVIALVDAFEQLQRATGLRSGPVNLQCEKKERIDFSYTQHFSAVSYLGQI